MSKYLWYSGATDTTGIALAEALGIESGKNRPRDKNIIIGWGTKTSEDIDLGNIKTLNHPNAVRKNRDKLTALKMMKADRNLSSNIAKFRPAVGILEAYDRGDVSSPMIGRKRHHQGGKGLWVCLVKSHIEKAVSDGAEYFQNYIDIKVEYRLHIFTGDIIYAVKKVENPTEAGWINQRREKIQEYANKHDINLNDMTVDCVLGRLVKEAVLPDQIVRSNKRGWKFSGVALNTIPTPLKNAAIKAVEIIGLDFGAVDCAIDVSDHPFIIEINTGPGLQGTSLSKYTEAFRSKLAEMERPGRVAQAAARVRRAVGANNADDPPVIDDEGLVQMMNAVRTPDEARRLLNIAMRRDQ